jgi:hypothetical protein
MKLVERGEHERATFSGGRRRLDEKVLLASLFVGSLLHRSHTEGVGFGRTAVPSVADRNGRHGFHFTCHAFASALRLLTAPDEAVILV